MKKVFEVDGAQYAVVKPTGQQSQQAQLVYNRTFRQAVKPEDGKGGAIVRPALESVLREQKLWDDTRQAEYDGIQKRLAEGERRLKKGGFKLSEARELAAQMRRDREGLRRLLADRNALDLTTAEAQAENARFEFLVSACTVDGKHGKPVWKSVDDYQAAADTPLAQKAAQQMANLVYGLDDDWDKKLPENEFLVKYGFMDAKLRWVNADGHLTDSQGRLIDEQGRYVDADGNFVDIDGNPLTAEGEYKVEFSPFVDDSGAPVAPKAAADTPGHAAEVYVPAPAAQV